MKQKHSPWPGGDGRGGGGLLLSRALAPAPRLQKDLTPAPSCRPGLVGPQWPWPARGGPESWEGRGVRAPSLGLLTQQEAAVVGGSGDEQRVLSRMSGVGWGRGLQAGWAGCVNVQAWQGLLEPAVRPVGRGLCEGCPSV